MTGKQAPEVAAALKKLNTLDDPLSKADPPAKFEETFESLQDAAVTAGEVVLVIGDFRKFRFSLAELKQAEAKK